MQAQVIAQPAARSRVTSASAIAYLGAAAFVTAAAWYTLAVRGVTVATAPRFGPHIPLQDKENIYYRWLVTTLPQERFYTSVAILAFLCLAWTAACARDHLGRDRTPARAGVFLTDAGVFLWVAGSIVQLGGHRAVGLMATQPSNPIDATNSIAFTIDLVSQAFSLAAFVLIAAAMLGFACAATAARGRHRLWAGYTAVIAAVMLVTAWVDAVGNGDQSDVLLLSGGVVLIPAWLIWTSRRGANANMVKA